MNGYHSLKFSLFEGMPRFCFAVAHDVGADFRFIKMTLHLRPYPLTWPGEQSEQSCPAPDHLKYEKAHSSIRKARTPNKPTRTPGGRGTEVACQKHAVCFKQERKKDAHHADVGNGLGEPTVRRHEESSCGSTRRACPEGQRGQRCRECRYHRRATDAVHAVGQQRVGPSVGFTDFVARGD